MTQTWMEGEWIAVTVDDKGTPTMFVWEEQRHTISRIFQRWEVETEWWRADGGIHRQYLALFTDRKMLCVIYHDLTVGDWRLVRLYD